MIEPQYVDGRKVAGLRSRAKLVHQKKALEDFFGDKQLRSITYGDIERYKSARLNTETIHGTQRSIAPVNRELALLRRMLNIATREGWLLKNPFNAGDPLINLADERKRERILTREEEDALLEQCVGRRGHLKPILVCAIDTGMRKGEIFKLVWSDVDFDNGIINVRAFNTKTLRERQVAMTRRLDQALRALRKMAPPDPNGLVFGIKDTVKTSFGGVRNDAKLFDVRFHDLRHTHATRLVAAHIPLSEVGRVLGHTQATRPTDTLTRTPRRHAARLQSSMSSITLSPPAVLRSLRALGAESSDAVFAPQMA